MVRRLLIFIVFVGAACTSVQPTDEPVSAAIEARARQSMAKLFPSKGLFVHKVRVDAGRRDLVMTGYLLLDREVGFQAVAVDEFGGKIFEFESCHGQFEVKFAPAALDHELLKRGPLQDLKWVYLPSETELRVRKSAEGNVLISWIDNERSIVCWAGADGQRVDRCHEVQRGRPGRTILFSYGDDLRMPSRMPSTIKIVNPKLHYTMTAELLRFEEKLNHELCP